MYFLGRPINYVLRVAARDPLRLLDMVSAAGLVPMRGTYAFDPLPSGGTRARIRVRGDASGLYRLAGPVLGRKVRSSLVKDLRDLQRQVSNRLGGRGWPWRRKPSTTRRTAGLTCIREDHSDSEKARGQIKDYLASKG